MANKAIRGREIDACYSVRMADTWTPVFDLSTPEKVAKYTKNTEEEISSVIRSVKLGRTGSDRYTPQDSLSLTRLMYDTRMSWGMKFAGEV